MKKASLLFVLISFLFTALVGCESVPSADGSDKVPSVLTPCQLTVDTDGIDTIKLVWTWNVGAAAAGMDTSSFIIRKCYGGVTKDFRVSVQLSGDGWYHYNFSISRNKLIRGTEYIYLLAKAEEYDKDKNGGGEAFSPSVSITP